MQERIRERITQLFGQLSLLFLILVIISLPFERDANSLTLSAEFCTVLTLALSLVARWGGLYVLRGLLLGVALLIPGVLILLLRGDVALVPSFLFQDTVILLFFALFVVKRPECLHPTSRVSFLPRLLYFGILAFMGTVYLSVLLSVEPVLSFEYFRKEVGTYVLLFLAVLHLAGSFREIKQLTLALYVAALVVALLGVMEWLIYLAGDYPIRHWLLRGKWVSLLYADKEFPILIQYPFRHHNRIGVFFLMGLGFALLQYYSTIKRVKRRWIAFSMLFILVAMLFTLNRNAFLGLLLALIIISLLIRWQNLIYLFLVLVLAVVLVPMAGKQRLFEVFSPQILQSPNVQNRLAGMRIAREIIGQYPWSGIGYGWKNFERYFDEHYADQISDVLPHSHNTLLQIWLESGPLSLLCFLLLYGGALAFNLRNHRYHPKDSNYRYWNAAFLVLLVVLLFCMQFNYLMRGSLGMFIWLTLGLNICFVSASQRIVYEKFDAKEG